MTYALYLKKMEVNPFLNYASTGLIGLNIVLAVILVDWLNVAAACTGIGVTIFANLGRIAHSVVYVRELYLNGWRLPKNEQRPQPQPEPTNNEQKNEVG
jgi:hypothetical protein